MGPRLGGLGQGAWAWAEGPGPGGLGQGAWAEGPGPGPRGLGLGREAWAGGGGTDVRTDGRTYGRTDGQNIPCILQNIAPLGPLPKKLSRDLSPQAASNP